MKLHRIVSAIVIRVFLLIITILVVVSCVQRPYDDETATATLNDPALPQVTIEIRPLVSAPEVTIVITPLASPPPTAQMHADPVFTYLHSLIITNTTHLLDSYATTLTFNDGDTAWTYDNALVLLAFLARGADADMATARMLANALVYAQNHDPDFQDGRLRDAYHAGAFSQGEGLVNVAQGGSATGNMAWATLALVRSWERWGDEAYLTAAQRLGQWIFDHTYDERGAGGYTGGFTADGTQFSWKATEHNADVYAAFMNLYQATDDAVWRDRAMVAKRFLVAMWNAEDGFFWTGTTDDGIAVNPSPIPEDAQSWTLLVMGEPTRFGKALSWAEATLYHATCPSAATVGGYRFSDVGSGCWWEGTAHMALAWQAVGETARADTLLQQLRKVHEIVPNSSGTAIPAASGTAAVTGYGWDYPAQVSHIGATAWYLFAELGHNPFWGTATTESIPFSGVYDPVAGAPSSATTPAAANFQEGISYTAWQQGGYSTAAADQALQELAATGAEWIALIVTCYQETHHSTAITCDQSRTPTDEDLVHAIAKARALGLKVMLKPHLDLNRDPGRWRGQIGETFTSEEQWQTWFESYQVFINHYANLATAQHVEQFCIGTELVGASHRDADWRAVVADVRTRYPGPLVYAANHGGEEMRLSWWDALDYIGVDAYYSLMAKNDPTPEELTTAWRERANDLRALSEREQKPILLAEIGYRSVDGATRAPWEWQLDAPVDLQEQADAYQAALGVLWGQPWLAGIYWWNWGADPEQGGPGDRDFTPNGKPAEEVLKAYYQRSGLVWRIFGQNEYVQTALAAAGFVLPE